MTTTNGDKLPVAYEDSLVTDRYIDEYIGEEFPRELVVKAMIDELRCVNGTVWQECSFKGAAASGSLPIRVRCVILQQGRFVAPRRAGQAGGLRDR